MLVDSHCHLEFSDFKDDYHDVITRAKNSGVSYFQTICTKISEFNKILKTAATDSAIFCSLGVHPSNVKNEGVYSAEQIYALTHHPKIIGIGETGLDYYYNKDALDEQKQSFKNHIIAASKANLPVIIHTRDAESDTISIIKEMKQSYEFNFLIHCFTGTKEFAAACLELGGYISFSGIVTFKNAIEIQEVAKSMPLERMLVETDAPYLAPAPYRGKRNEPAYVAEVAKFVADLRGVPYKEFCEVTTGNFLKLFSRVSSL